MVAKKVKSKGKKRISAKKLCSGVIQREGVKKDGTLKKIFRKVKVDGHTEEVLKAING